MIEADEVGFLHSLPNAVKRDPKSYVYVYDALNHRVAITGPHSETEQFVFNPQGQRVATLDDSGTPISQQTYLGRSPLAFFQNGSFHFQHQDWLGTERIRTSQTGATEGTFSSLPFGERSATTGSDDDPSHFTGLDQDGTGANHAMFRDYNSATGTWMRPDPYSGSYDFSKPQSMNRYAYVLNNPLVLRDPTGLYCEYGDDAGEGVLEEVDYDSSPSECGGTGGSWFPDGSTTWDGIDGGGGGYGGYGGVGGGGDGNGPSGPNNQTQAVKPAWNASLPNRFAVGAGNVWSAIRGTIDPSPGVSTFIGGFGGAGLSGQKPLLAEVKDGLPYVLGALDYDLLVGICDAIKNPTPCK